MGDHWCEITGVKCMRVPENLSRPDPPVGICAPTSVADHTVEPTRSAAEMPREARSWSQGPVTYCSRLGCVLWIHPRKREEQNCQDYKLQGTRLRSSRTACEPLWPMVRHIQQMSCEALTIVSGVRLRENHHVRE